MTNELETLRRMKKADKLVRLAFRKNGPKSYKRGQGALVATISQMGGSATQKELVQKMGISRGALKDIVRKAQRNEYVAIEDAEEKGAYQVTLTEDGKALAEKREASVEKVAADVLSALTAEEVAQLNAINEKLIVSLNEKGISAKKKGHKHSKRMKHRH